MRGDERFDLSGLLVDDAHLRGVAVSHVGHGVRHVRAELIGLGKIFAIEFLPGKLRKRVGFQRCGKLFTGTPARLARHKRLTGAGGIAGVRRDPGIGAFIDDIAALQRRIRDDHLHEHRTNALADAGSARIDIKDGRSLTPSRPTASPSPATSRSTASRRWIIRMIRWKSRPRKGSTRHHPLLPNE